MKETFFNYYPLPYFFIKSLRLDGFSRKKLWHYLKKNTSLKELFIGNFITFIYLVSLIVMIGFGITYVIHPPEQLKTTEHFYVGFGFLSIDSFDMIFYIFVVLSTVLFGLILMSVDSYEKYIIKYPCIVLIGILERAKKVEFVIFMSFFAIMMIKGWTMQAISLLFFLYLKMEAKRTLMGVLRMRAALLYSHMTYKELRKFLVK